LVSGSLPSSSILTNIHFYNIPYTAH